MKLLSAARVGIRYWSRVDLTPLNRYAGAFRRTTRIDCGMGRFCAMLLGIMMNAMTSANADAARLEVVREIHPEGGMPEPQALAQTKEGGYVIAGVDHDRAVAIRIDANGKLQWRHMADSGQSAIRKSNYQGVTVLSDDTALLCGWSEREQHSIEGLLTHIGKDGSVISQRAVHPNQGDKIFSSTYLPKCVPWGDGTAVVGTTVQVSGDSVPRHFERFGWVLALDGKADLKWEKLLPNAGGTAEALVTPNQDLVISPVGTQITRIDLSGSTKAQKVVPGLLVRQTQPEALLHVLLSPNEQTSVLRTLDEHLNEMQPLSGRAEAIDAKVAYRLPDGSLVLFGFERGPVLKAAVSWMSSDLNKREKLIFDSYGDSISIWVSDAVPTGNPGEFVAVRPIVLNAHSGSSAELGLVLSFVRIK